MSRPFFPRSASNSGPQFRINGKIRAREVRVIGPEGNQLGILSLNEALGIARRHNADLVEIAPNATPPVCRVVDYGKFRYEQSKKEKDAKKHQHANKVKEIQLSPNIDPHDFGVKLMHAIDFLCEEMKVKVTLRFRGREMAHQEFGFQVVNKFIKEVTPYGHPDAPPKLAGRSINLMLSPLPRNKRAKHPKEVAGEHAPTPAINEPLIHVEVGSKSNNSPAQRAAHQHAPAPAEKPAINSPFANLDIEVRR
ncbi:MAG: translation initiation factor IF-3 [Verrucomicrobiota bacterium]